MAETLAERLRNRDKKIDEAVELAQTGTPAPAPKKKKKKKAAPKVGTGQSSFDLDGAIAKIRAKQAATQDPALKERLEARIQALKANAQ